MKCSKCGIEIEQEYNYCPNCQNLLNQNILSYKEDNIKMLNIKESEISKEKFKKSYLLSKLEIFESVLMVLYSAFVIVMPAIAKILAYPIVIIFCSVASSEGGAPNDCSSINLYLSNPLIIIMLLVSVMFLLINIYIFNQLKGSNNSFNYKTKKVFEYFPLLVFIGIILFILSIFCVITTL